MNKDETRDMRGDPEPPQRLASARLRENVDNRQLHAPKAKTRPSKPMIAT